MFFPQIIETTGRSSKLMDLPSRLLQDRIVYLCGEINAESANIAIMQLLWLNSANPEKDINLYINSPGGHVYEGYAIKDVIDNITCKVNTVGIGMCASMGAFLLSGGTGERKATKNCRIMLHSISGGHQGTYHDMKIDFEESKYIQDKMIGDIAGFSKGKLNSAEVADLTLRDKYMSPQEAIEKGLLDACL